MKDPTKFVQISAGVLLAVLAAGVLLIHPSGDFVNWLGRFHPLLVHLPIGFLIALLALEIWAPEGAAKRTLLAAAALVAVLAVLAGLCLGDDYDAETLTWHKWTGVITATLTIAVAVAGWLGYVLAYRGLLGAALLALVLAGHHGASLTHGSDYLTPPGFEKSENPEEDVTFAGTILPIFKAKCLACHGPSKTKAGLRLDLARNVLDGGASGRPAVLPGDLAGSHLVERITLPPGQKKVMPPAGRSRLTADELRTILYWIHNGAPGLPEE